MAVIRPSTIASLREELPHSAQACVRAIVDEVPGYDRESDSEVLATITSSVEMALAAFLDSLEHPGSESSAQTAMRIGAHRLGRGEAETGRSSDALLTAYRVGAREAWTQFARIALAEGEDAAAIAGLAAGTFTFIDDLSAQSIAGHTAAMSARTRELERRRDDLAAALISGESRATLEHLAERAHWNPPRTLTALVVVGQMPSRARSVLPERTLWAAAPGAGTLVFLPDLTPSARVRVLESCASARAAMGPDLPWSDASESVMRARRALRFARDGHPADSDALLPELLLDADPLVAELLRERALAPMDGITPAKREVLAQTLLAWLLHQGHRDDVAAELHVHPQTVRYRMNTLRELYDRRLSDPRNALELTLGLLANRTREQETS